MAKAAKKAVKAKPKRKSVKKAAAKRATNGAHNLAERRRPRSKAQAFADSQPTVDDLIRNVNQRVSNQAELLAGTRGVVNRLTASMAEHLPKIHSQVEQLCADHAQFRSMIAAHLVPTVKTVGELATFADRATAVINRHTGRFDQLEERVAVIEQLLRS